jgi:fatty acid desaturase
LQPPLEERDSGVFFVVSSLLLFWSVFVLFCGHRFENLKEEEEEEEEEEEQQGMVCVVGARR